MTAGGKHGRRGLYSLLALVVVALVVVGGVIAWRVTGGGGAAAAAPPPPLSTPVQRIAPVDPNAPVPTPGGTAEALRGALDNPALGDLTGRVTDAITGEVLWSQDPDRPRTPASVTKLLTTSAALESLPRDERLTTTVVQGADGRVVLVGGGDPTLTAEPEGTDGYYPGAAHIDALADQIRAAGIEPTGVDVDVSLYTGPLLAQGWYPADIPGGNIAPMQPIMIDGARLDITDPDSPRSDTPALDAGAALARALGLDPDADGTVRLADAPTGAPADSPAGAQPIASVQSAPMVELIRQLLVHSDNVLAEAVGRQVALASGDEASFAGAVSGVESTLRGAGFDLAGATLHDTSGMSVDNALPARLIDDVVGAAAQGHPRLRVLLDSIPVAGGTGTLADRYDGAAHDAAGWVRAKTGTLSGVSTLAGVVTDVDGRVLTFALMSGGTSPADARPALDDVAAALRGCGCGG